MLDRLSRLNASLDEDSKVRMGVVFLVLGTIVIGAIAFGAFPSFIVEVVLAAIGVVLMVAGSLTLGTSDSTGRAV